MDRRSFLGSILGAIGSRFFGIEHKPSKPPMSEVDWTIDLAMRDMLKPGEVFVGLHCEYIDKEISPKGYKRQPVFFSTPKNGKTHNVEPIYFNPAKESWPTITGFGIYDKSGVLLYSGTLVMAKGLVHTIIRKDVFMFEAGALEIDASR